MTTNQASKPRSAIKPEMGDETSLTSGVVLSMDHSPAITGADRVSVIAERIKSNWQKSLEGIRQVALDCAEAKEFSLSERKRLSKQLPFSDSMFSKLASIGADQRLVGAEYDKALPPSISTLYELHKLSDDQFNKAVSEGAISATLTRQKLLKWRGQSHIRNSLPTISGELYCLYSKTPLPTDQRSEVCAKMIELADNHELKAEVFTGENLLVEVKKLLSSN